MSIENPVLLYSNPPWSSVVDMAAAMVTATSSSSAPMLSEVMDLDSAPPGDQSPWLVSSFAPVDQSSLPSPLVSPHHIFFKPSSDGGGGGGGGSAQSSYRSLGSIGAFSFDSSLLEDLLGDQCGGDITSRDFSTGAPPGADNPPKNRDFFTERIKEALRLISRSQVDALAQVWVPIVAPDNKIVLTTQEQPYSVMHSKFDLLRYRTLSTAYVFPSEKPMVTSGSTSAPHAHHLGLPGRVFSSRAPEWTPNVQFYDSSEYLRVGDAAKCDVKGLVAVPVLDPSSKSCLAVIELVTNVEKVEFGREIGTICSALQAVDLAGAPKEGDLMLLEIHTETREAVYQEISEILRTVCETHKLPIAQTWLPCIHNGSGGEEKILVPTATPASASTNTDHHISLFTKDAPFYLSDNRFLGFHQACADHSLDRSQGVAGKAFTSNQPCFVPDVKNYLIEEYPLVHHARYFKLGGAVAVRLRSSITGAADYVVEFFLPAGMESGAALLQSISATMRRSNRSLRMLSAEEWQLEQGVESTAVVAPRPGSAKKNHPIVGDRVEAKHHKTKKTRAASVEDIEAGEDFNSWGSGGGGGAEASTSKVKRLERKKSMTEKTIGLDVLQRYFAGSLKDAAKSIGVCPTTLKRICRQNGISRWPSRKINKVSRSLIKLQGVIDSVQGLDGAVKLNALTGELASAAAAAAAITKKSSSPTRSSVDNPAAAVSPFEARLPSPPPAFSHEQQNVNAIKDFVSETEEKPSGDEGDGRSRSRSPWLSGYLETAAEATTSMAQVKLEPRVHGSSAALAALNGGPLEADNGWDQSRIETGHVSTSPQSSGGDSPASPPPHYRYNYAIITIKATMGNDTVRFKLPYTGFGYGRLREEISGRFRVDGEGFTLKYLDDDSEWVVLDGDADLEECLDVMKGASAHAIKLVVKENNSSHSLSSVKL